VELPVGGRAVGPGRAIRATFGLELFDQLGAGPRGYPAVSSVSIISRTSSSVAQPFGGSGAPGAGAEQQPGLQGGGFRPTRRTCP